MANNVAINPLFVDTASASTLLSMRLFVGSVRWVGATTAGHHAIIQDVDGNVMWKAVATGANNSEAEYVNNKRPWIGLKVPTLDSGELYISLRHDI